jgi:hypothetical protein
MNLNYYPLRALAGSFLWMALVLPPALGQTASEASKPAGTTSVRVLVAYDSLTGNTEKWLKAWLRGPSGSRA